MWGSAAGWFALISVISISLIGFGSYFALISVLTSFIIGVITVLFLSYDKSTLFSQDIDSLDDPLQQVSFSPPLTKVLELFKLETNPVKFDNRITGSETVDTILNEIIIIIINDYVASWYEIIADDVELTQQSIRKLAVAAGVNLSNRIKSVDWIHLLATRFPEELNSHLKLYKQSRVRLKHIHLLNAKDVYNGNKQSPKKQEEKKTHKRNKSDTDLSWPPESNTYGKSTFYESTETVNGKKLEDLFFDLECVLENKQICRDIFSRDPEMESALLYEISEAVLYLVAPEEVWKCHAMKLLLVELISSAVLRPMLELLSEPDTINRAIIRICCREICLSSELFLMVVRCSSDAEELDATLELVQKDIQKLHSKDSAGEWEIQDRQKLSSLHYLTRIIQARRATLAPDEGLTSTTDSVKVSEEVTRSLKFLSITTAWRSNAQYCLDIELNELDSPHSVKTVIDSLRSSALEICDLYLSPNRPTLLGIPENCHADLVRKITTDGEEFSKNPVACFDDLQKSIYDALEDDPSWQSDYMFDEQDNDNIDVKKTEKDKKIVKCKKIVRSCFKSIPKLFGKQKLPMNFQQLEYPTNRSSSFPRYMGKTPKFEAKSHTLPKCKTCGDTLPLPGMPLKHNRSRSDIVGNPTKRMINESSGTSNLSKSNSNNLSVSHSEICHSFNKLSQLTACIIETALVQEKNKMFGIYAIAVTRLSDNEMWHIYRRYSDFHDLHSSIKERWPELSQLPFPAKKTFQNTSRSVLESRKRMLNNYLQSLSSLSREMRYASLLSNEYLGGFLSPEKEAERQNISLDALFVNSIRAGMRTLKNMPDQFVNTVDGVMDGISKVFQSKSAENPHEPLKMANSTDGQEETDESAALRLLEEVLGLRGLWLRRRLLAPVRTLIADRVNKKVLEFVLSLTSPRSIVQYLKSFKHWLLNQSNQPASNRDQATKARTRVAAKVGLLSACSDELKHIAGSDMARRGLLTMFDLFQSQEINRRLLYIFFEAILINLFPDNNFQEMFRKVYSNSPRVPVVKKSVYV